MTRKSCPPAGFDARGVNFERRQFWPIKQRCNSEFAEAETAPKESGNTPGASWERHTGGGRLWSERTQAPRVCASARRAWDAWGKNTGANEPAPAPARGRERTRHRRSAHTHKPDVPRRGCCGRCSHGKRRNADEDHRTQHSAKTCRRQNICQDKIFVI